MKKIHLMFCTAAVIVSLVTVAKKTISDDAQAIFKVPTTHKVVALTIDDGPNYKATPKILATLKEKQVRASFFVVGSNVERYPKLLAQEVAEGHEIGVHTYSHPLLTKLNAQSIAEEFSRAEQAIGVIAPKPTLFRPPGGFYNAKVVEAARRHGYTIVMWSVDPKDWSRPPVDKIIEKILADVKPGSIILLHDGQYPIPTTEALPIIIERLRERGYEFVTVSELLQYNEVRPTFQFLRWHFNG